MDSVKTEALEERETALIGSRPWTPSDNATTDTTWDNAGGESSDESVTSSSLIPYKVIERNSFGHWKDSYTLLVEPVGDRLPTAEDLGAISMHLKRPGFQRTFVSFYLPGMEVNAGCFATAHHNPHLEVTILWPLIPDRYRHLVDKQFREFGARERRKRENEHSRRQIAEERLRERRAQVETTETKRWYQGGTLHKKSALEWQTASYADKLATCADFVTHMWQSGHLKASIANSLSTVDDVRPYAQELVSFLDAAFPPDPDPDQNRRLFANQTVASTSAIAMVVMQWTK